MKQVFMLLWVGFVCSAPVFAAGGGEEGGHHGFDWLHFAQNAVNTGLFFLILYLLLRKPFKEFFSKRLADIKEALDLAERSRDEAKLRLTEIEEKMTSLETELKDIEEQAHLDAEREKERIQEATQNEVDRILEQAKSEIDFRGRQAVQTLKAHAVELSFELVKKELESKCDAKTSKQLLDEFVNEMGA